MKGARAWLSTALLAIGLLWLGCVDPMKLANEENDKEAIPINDIFYTVDNLESFRGLPFIRVIETLHLEGCRATYWTEEPPGHLKGVVFFLEDGVSVTLFLDPHEPMYKSFNDRDEWDCGAVFLAKVGGVTVASREKQFAVGNGGWEWLPPPRKTKRNR
jgi:hypothetical protein